MDLETAFSDHTVYFDPTDPANNGLYLCLPETRTDNAAELLIDRLVAAGLWSVNSRKTVKAEQKPDYIEQLHCEEVIALHLDGLSVFACATNHPKFPLDRQRWQAWKHVLLAEP